MKLILPRTVLVMAALAAPQFMTNSAITFKPFAQMHQWVVSWLPANSAAAATVDKEQLVWTFALLVGVPLLFAVWFSLLDHLRQDIGKLKTKLWLHLIIAGFSWLAMAYALNLSSANGGPIAIGSWYHKRLLFETDILTIAQEMALVLVGIELFTWWFARLMASSK